MRKQASDIDRAVCAVIRKMRRNQEIKQITIGEQIGMSQSAYARIELGRVNVLLATLQKVAAVYGVKVSDLLKQAGY